MVTIGAIKKILNYPKNLKKISVASPTYLTYTVITISITTELLIYYTTEF